MSVPQMLARMEHNIGWVFHSKLTAIEALNSAGQPINYDGQWHNLRRNDNLAIIGDKALDQVLSLMWYHSSNPQGLQSMSAKKNKMLMRPRRLFNQGSLVNSSTGPYHKRKACDSWVQLRSGPLCDHECWSRWPHLGTYDGYSCRSNRGSRLQGQWL